MDNNRLRMKKNTEMVCLRNFKRCRPPD
ncbi:uncharacterized protein LOC128928213 [Callithrix jacchus]